jgi:hypothetical protein
MVETFDSKAIEPILEKRQLYTEIVQLAADQDTKLSTPDYEPEKIMACD